MAGTFFDNIFNSVLARPVTQDTGFRGDKTVPTILNPDNIGSFTSPMLGSLTNPFATPNTTAPAPAMPTVTGPTMLTGQGGIAAPAATPKTPTPKTPSLTPTAQQNQAALGYVAPPNIPSLEESKAISDFAASQNNGRISTFSPSDLANGQKSSYQKMLEQAMQYYLGYDTSPEAKRLAELQSNLGKLQGAQAQSLTQIETTPGLTSFQSGRRQQALAQAAGGVTEPIIAEINAITGRQEAAQKRMTNAMGIAEKLQPSTIGSPIVDDKGNATIITSDPLTGGYHTVNLGKIGSAKPASNDIAEYEYSKQNGGFNGTFLQFLAQKTSATTKASTSGGSSSDLATLAQSVLDNPELFNQLTPTLKGKLAPLLSRVGFTGFGKALSDGAIAKINDTKTGIRELTDISVEAENLKAYTGPGAGIISMIPGSQTQKLRSGIDRVRQIVGKALEGGVLRKEDEEKYMRILPAITDLPSVVAYKIKNVTEQMENDMNSYISLQAASGRNTAGVASSTNTYAPGTILTNASGQKGRVEADGSITIIQ